METRVNRDDALAGQATTTAAGDDSGATTRGLAGTLIVLGLGVETATLFWEHPTSFLLFAAGGASLVVVGILLYLWSLVRS